MDRLSQTFADLKAASRKAFVAYIAAGDPDFDKSLETMKALADAGAPLLSATGRRVSTIRAAPARMRPYPPLPRPER